MYTMKKDLVSFSVTVRSAQMSVPQSVMPSMSPLQGAVAHQKAPYEVSRLKAEPWLGLFLLALGCLVTPLRAQSRGTLQVAAQVLPAAPSREALALGMGSVLGSRLEGNQPLAAILVARSAGPTGDSATDRPKAILTISFVRN
jgi:hypothetical protein